MTTSPLSKPSYGGPVLNGHLNLVIWGRLSLVIYGAVSNLAGTWTTLLHWLIRRAITYITKVLEKGFLCPFPYEGNSRHDLILLQSTRKISPKELALKRILNQDILKEHRAFTSFFKTDTYHRLSTLTMRTTLPDATYLCHTSLSSHTDK